MVSVQSLAWKVRIKDMLHEKYAGIFCCQLEIKGPLSQIDKVILSF